MKKLDSVYATILSLDLIVINAFKVLFTIQTLSIASPLHVALATAAKKIAMAMAIASKMRIQDKPSATATLASSTMVLTIAASASIHSSLTLTAILATGLQSLLFTTAGNCKPNFQFNYGIKLLQVRDHIRMKKGYQCGQVSINYNPQQREKNFVLITTSLSLRTLS